jgi:predicted DNA-binding transcriptional regulator AlpA
LPRKRIDYSRRGNLTLREAMEYTGLGHKKVKANIDAGHWQAFWSGPTLRVIKSSIDEWMAKEAEGYVPKPPSPGGSAGGPSAP